MKGINLNPVIPVRVDAHEQSEQCTQLLFGEIFTYEECNEKWCSITNEADGYEGYVSKNMVTPLSEEEYGQLCKAKKTVITTAVATIQCGDSNMLLPMGSILYDCAIKGTRYEPTESSSTTTKENVVEVAMQMLHAPYLWGGKSIMGIDCSGFVQTVFKACGKQLQRDASQQVNEGDIVCFLAEGKSGDLAFFENQEGNIVHVGILIDNKHIIHSSGCVKINPIDDYGIVGENGYTHKLRVIKRIKC